MEKTLGRKKSEGIKDLSKKSEKKSWHDEKRDMRAVKNKYHAFEKMQCFLNIRSQALL